PHGSRTKSPHGDLFSRLSARFHSQGTHLASQNPTKIHQKQIRREVLHSFDGTDFFEDKVLFADHIDILSRKEP
ncbi:MAG: hypothetical protein IJY16_02865, partial [Clostridia bacterium]|nr:hypothetical protein [Clostridia bacterium]